MTIYHTIEQYEGSIYVVERAIDVVHPILHTRWFITHIDVSEFLESMGRKHDFGRPLLPAGPGIFRMENGNLVSSFTTPEFECDVAIPVPGQRGKQLETRWSGRWEKLTKDGWQAMERPSRKNRQLPV